NWLQENASYAMPKQARKSRFQLQEYLSPTASFRTLSGGGNYTVPKSNVQNIPIASTHLGNPNDYVDHKPGAGVELGATIAYRLTRNIAIKTGLQLNYSRYTIEAYSSYSPQPATITLNSVYGFSPNSITSYTNVQNFGGNSTQTLQNQYFDLSAPVGLEIKVLGNEKLQFNIAATIEPTYLLNRNSYLLATDYSNYIKDPTLFRRWNFNGGVEAFVSYKIGQFRLQAGPQFRYQLLSTYVGAYPIKENLKEYGLKIGLSKSIW
ncbi:MAG TPA: outer membrane beta-barrel protein, partial [Puia sp.]|nr:outer membrane beta-barrel protein [Puia sp.]